MTKQEIEKCIKKTTELHDEILTVELSSTKSYLLGLTWTILSELQREYETKIKKKKYKYQNFGKV